MTILILIVLALGAVIGCYQGAFKQLANLLGVVVGIILAATLYKQGGDFLAAKSGTSTGVAQMAAFIIIVIIVPILLGFIASLFTKLFSTIHLGCLNRLIGAAIGVLCYGLLLSFAFNMYDFIESKFGFAPEALEQREDLFYEVKHVCQPLVPDLIIVTDSTEVAHGAKAHRGVRSVVDRTLKGADVVDKTIEKVIGEKAKSIFGNKGEEQVEE